MIIVRLDSGASQALNLNSESPEQNQAVVSGCHLSPLTRQDPSRLSVMCAPFYQLSSLPFSLFSPASPDPATAFAFHYTTTFNFHRIPDLSFFLSSHSHYSLKTTISLARPRNTHTIAKQKNEIPYAIPYAGESISLQHRDGRF